MKECIGEEETSIEMLSLARTTSVEIERMFSIFVFIQSK